AGEDRQRPLAERRARRLRLDGREQSELGDETVVFGGELAVHPVGEGVVRELPFEQRGRVGTPARALGEPRERRGGGELAGGLRDHVVVGRRAAAAEGGQVLLMPTDLR